MAETLRQKQSRFAKMVGWLIQYAYEQGYEITLGDAYRSPGCAALYVKMGKGIINSLHTQRLAIDLNLFLDGEYLTASEDHRVLGEYWKSLAPDCRWGGDFDKPDGNHYSIEHDGVK